MVSAAAHPSAKKTPFRTQEGLHTKDRENLCTNNGAPDDVFNIDGSRIAIQDLALLVRETDLRGHHLGVGVASVHFIVTLKMAVQTQFLKLVHSHTSI